MKEVLIKCDKCGAADAKTIHINGSEYTDAAGGRDRYSMSVDICGDCAITELTHALNDCRVDDAFKGSYISYILNQKPWEWSK